MSRRFRDSWSHCIKCFTTHHETNKLTSYRKTKLKVSYIIVQSHVPRSSVQLQAVSLCNPRRTGLSSEKLTAVGVEAKLAAQERMSLRSSSKMNSLFVFRLEKSVSNSLGRDAEEVSKLVAETGL